MQLILWTWRRGSHAVQTVRSVDLLWPACMRCGRIRLSRARSAQYRRAARGHGFFIESLWSVHGTRAVLKHALNHIEVLSGASSNATSKFSTVELQVRYKFRRCRFYDCCGTSSIQWLHHTYVIHFIELYTCTVRFLSSPPPVCVVLEVSRW